MKNQYSIIALFLLATLVLACSLNQSDDPTNAKKSPTETYLEFSEAAKTTDTEHIKSFLSKDSIKMMTKTAESQGLTLDKLILRGTIRKDNKVELRNEKIDGNNATLEQRDDKYSPWSKSFLWSMKMAVGNLPLIKLWKNKAEDLEKINSLKTIRHIRKKGEMTMNTKFTQILSLITFYSLAFTFIIPTQIFAENFPANSVFNQNKNQINQTKNPQVDKSFGNIPVYFEQNNGQFNDKVKYFARGTSGYSLFLTATEAVYVLQSSKSQVSGSKSVV